GVRASEGEKLEGPGQKPICKKKAGDVRAPWLVEHRRLRPTTQVSDHINGPVRAKLHGAQKSDTKGSESHALRSVQTTTWHMRELRLRHKLGQGTCFVHSCAPLCWVETRHGACSLLLCHPLR